MLQTEHGKARPKRKSYGVKKQPAKPAPAFRPISAQTKPFAPAQKRARKQTAKARKQIPANPKLPRVPIKKSYTAKERRTIYAGLHKARGKGSNQDLYNASNNAERKYLRALGKRLAKPQRSKVRFEPKREKQGMRFAGTTKIAGFLPIPGLHQLGFTADQILDNLARPAHAVTSAAYAAQEGRSPLTGAAEGFTGKRVKTGSDLLKRHGMSNTPAAILGTIGDIAVDPLNVVTGGTGSAASKLLTESQRLAHHAEELKRAGRAAEAAKVAAKADEKAIAAARAPTNKGIQVGVRLGKHEAKTSGRATAALSRRLGISAAATHLRNQSIPQALGRALDPAFRPRGVTDQEWRQFRKRFRQSRAEANTGIRAAERRGRAYAKALRDAKKRGHEAPEKQIIDALERARIEGPTATPGEVPTMPREASINSLPDDLKPIAIAARKDLKAISNAEQEAKILDRIVRNYVPHQWTRQAQKEARKAERRGRRNPYGIRREDTRPISEQHADLPEGVAPKFDTDLARLIGNRAGKSAELLANRRFADNVVQDIGRKFDKVEDLRPGDHVYIAGRGLRSIGDKVDQKAIVKAARGLEPDERFVVLPRVIGDAVAKGVVPHAAGGDLLRHYDKFMNGLKTLLTVLNFPAYDLRNLSGDLFLARQAGTDPKSLYDGLRLVAMRTRRNRGEERHLKDAFSPTTKVSVGRGITERADDLLAEMEKHGAIGTGFHGNELQEFETHAPRTRGLIKQMRRIGGTREDSVRAGTYLAARRRGMTPAEAAEWTNKHHFDYSDLTPQERDVLRRIFPFYTFTARNTRLQAEKLLTRPGVAANYGLAMDEGRKQAGLGKNYEDKLPDYYRRGLGIPFGKKLLFPQLPITDLNRLAAITKPREQFGLTAQMLNPLFKWGFEPLANYSLFFRGPIYQDADHPDAPHYVPAPGWVKVAPEPIRVMLAGGNADAARQGLWTAKADYVGRLTPQQNTLTQVTTARVGSRNQDWRDALASQLTGVKINQYDGLKFKIDKLFDQRNAIDAKLADARKLGHGRGRAYERLLAERRRLDAKILKARIKHGDDVKKPESSSSRLGTRSLGSGRLGTRSLGTRSR